MVTNRIGIRIFFFCFIL